MINTQKASFIRSAAVKKDFIHDDRPGVAFAGRSNVGKSSLINSLLNRKNFARVGYTPGKTTQVNYFRVDGIYFIDLPGYGYAKVSKQTREKIDCMIDDYVLNSQEMMVLFVLLDSRHDLLRNDLDFLIKLGNEGVPFAIVFTKCDKLGVNALAAQVEKNKQALLEYWETLPPVFVTSAQTGAGTGELLDYIEGLLETVLN